LKKVTGHRHDLALLAELLDALVFVLRFNAHQNYKKEPTLVAGKKPHGKSRIKIK